MTNPQPITNTRLKAGDNVFALQATQQVFTTAMITIDRTVNNGLNSLTNADTLDVLISYSLDGGNTWIPIAQSHPVGGQIPLKTGGFLATDTLTVGRGQPFPIGTGFQATLTASTAVNIAGSVLYN